MSQDAIQVLSGDCSIQFDGDEERHERGSVLVLIKPDNTILVHDRTGYRPVAWLTRADTLSWSQDHDGFSLDAVDGDRRLRVTCHDEYETDLFGVSITGQPISECPSCNGMLIHYRGTVMCLGCNAHYSIPRDATVLGEGADRCDDCGLPSMRVERGSVFEVCVDRECDSLDDQVRDRYDRAWTCPECADDLRILRRGGLIAGCASYPACQTGYAIPAGTINGECESCGLPEFEMATGSRCLDTNCANS